MAAIHDIISNMTAHASTLEFYNANAKKLLTRYESAQVDDVHGFMASHLEPGARVLELGCGSGRDAAWMLASGYEVTAVDGSTAMLSETLAAHPQLAGHLQLADLGEPLPFPSVSFDAVVSIAVVMHLTEARAAALIAEIRRVLVPGGILVFSVCIRRPDPVTSGLDSRGRWFTVREACWWLGLCAGAGLMVTADRETSDGLGRDGVTWLNCVCVKPSTGSVMPGEGGSANPAANDGNG